MKYSQLTRLFIKENLQNEFITLNNSDDIHYLVKVLRKKKNDQLLIFNNINGEYLVEIKEISNKTIIFKTIEHIKFPIEKRDINLIFAPIKQHRMITMLEKATELGVTKLTPIITKHSVVDKINLNKWQIYLKEAAEQCGRLSIPTLYPVIKLEKFLEEFNSGEILFCNEQEKSSSFFEAAKTTDKINTLNILIGPEGGFSDQERNILNSNSLVRSVHLGNLILRAETAAIVALTLANNT